MLDCFSTSFRQFSSDNAENHRLTSQDYSAGTTPRSNDLSSPNINHRFNELIQTPSFLDIKTKICAVEEYENGDVTQFLNKVIEPNPDHGQNVLSLASNSNPFTHHLSPYFLHTEQVCRLLLKLERWVHHTRNHYQPIKTLNQDSLNQEQCHSVSETLKHFGTKEIPNPYSGPHNLNNMHACSSNLKEHVNGSFLNNSKPVSCMPAKLAMAALSALFTGSSFSTVSKLSKKDLAYIGLLDNAARSAFTLHNEVQTMEQLVRNIQTCVESDRSFIRVCAGRGHECYLVIQVVKHLGNSFEKISFLLGELEAYICRCFKGINNERRFLLQGINQVRQS